MDLCPRTCGPRPQVHRTLPRAKKVSPGHFFALPRQGRPFRVLYLECHTKKTKPIQADGLCFLVDDIGLEPMTFRTSKEFPTGRYIPVGKNTAFFGGKSVNRVDPIDTNLSYRGRKNKGYLYRAMGRDREKNMLLLLMVMHTISLECRHGKVKHIA